MLRSYFGKVRQLLKNREAVFLLEIVAAIIAGLLFAVSFLDATPVELLVIIGGLALMVAVGYGLRFLRW